MKNKPEPMPLDTDGDIPANEAPRAPEPDAGRASVKIGDWSPLTPKEIAQRAADRPGYRLGRDQVLSLIKAATLQSISDTTAVVCVLVCHSGHVEVGISACIDPAIYDEEIGRTMAFNDAFDKLYQKEGYIARVAFKSASLQKEQAQASADNAAEAKVAAEAAGRTVS